MGPIIAGSPAERNQFPENIEISKASGRPDYALKLEDGRLVRGYFFWVDKQGKDFGLADYDTVCRNLGVGNLSGCFHCLGSDASPRRSVCFFPRALVSSVEHVRWPAES
jgi:hypothetical protein